MSAWIPLMDYAIKKSVSISTLRRYIKSNKIKYRTEGGKYFLWDDEVGAQFLANASSVGEQRSLLMPGFSMGREASDIPKSEDSVRLQKLEMNLQKAQEEIAELKMLVSLYEDQLLSNRPNA